MVAALIALPFVALACVAALAWWQGRQQPVSQRLAALLLPAGMACAFALAFQALSPLPPDVGRYAGFAALGVACAVADGVALFMLRDAGTAALEAERVAILRDYAQAQDIRLAHAREDAAQAQLIRHEVLCQLDQARDLLEKQDAAAIGRGLRGESLSTFAQGAYCAHPVLDALLAIKARTCQSHGVRLDVAVGVPAGLAVADVDICALFSNALDNALHACDLVEEGKRFIAVEASAQGGFLLAEVRNSCAAQQQKAPSARERLRQGQHPQHGWGLAIIQDVAARYGGTFDAQQEGGTFTLSVALALKDADALA